MSEPSGKASRFSSKYIGVIVTIVTLIISVAIWAGATGANVADNADDIIDIEFRVNTIESHGADVDLNQAVIMNQLRNIDDKLEEIKADLKELKSQE